MIMRELDIYNYFHEVDPSGYSIASTINQLADTDQFGQPTRTSTIYRMYSGKTFIVTPCFTSELYERFVTIDEFFGTI